MEDSSKRHQMVAWIKENPGKTGRDWLLEVRCQDDTQRKELQKLFQWVDEGNASDKTWNHVQLAIVPPRESIKVLEGAAPFVDFPDAEHIWVNVDFDFKLMGWPYDLDAPKSVYNTDSNRNVWDYAKWKAKELGLENTNFADRLIKRLFSSALNSYPHWSYFPEKYPHKD